MVDGEWMHCLAGSPVRIMFKARGHVAVERPVMPQTTSHGRQIVGLVALHLFVANWLRFADAPATPFYPLVVELSYAIGRVYQRQGYATEACQAVIEYGFKEMGLPRLANGLVPENVPLAALLSFELAGCRRPCDDRHKAKDCDDCNNFGLFKLFLAGR